MKILIVGAGVIGSVYAIKLHESNCDVTLLARSKHSEELSKNGVTIKDIATGSQTTTKIPVITKLASDDFYDLVIVTVRLDQVETVVPVLKMNTVCPLVMFMFNNPDNIGQLANELAPRHIILGFPGVGGTYKNGVIEYIMISQQKTTIGEINGENSVRINEIKSLFEKAGFKVTINFNMQAWLKTHALFVACIAAAIIGENGDSVQLGKNKSSVKIMVKSIREGFTALKSLGIPISPFNLKMIFLIMPQWFSVLYWQNAMQSETGTLAMAPHANRAKGEMQLLAKRILSIVHTSSLPTPTLNKLLSSFQAPAV